jgi:TamB, inner membrane protein subunit of TAM complex
MAGIALTMPVVQTKLAKYYVEKLNKKYNININIDEVAITIYGGVKLKKVFIKDYKNDTLIYSKTIHTNILDSKKLLDGDLIFGDIKLDGLVFKMINYKGEKDNNLDKFIDAFGTSKSSGKPFFLKAKNVQFTNSRYVLTNYNHQNPQDLDLKKLNTNFENFQLLGSNIDVKILNMSFLDHRGLFVDNLATQFSYSDTKMKLENFELLTKKSAFKGKIIMDYERKDFADFENKVLFDVKIDSASIDSGDVHHFYDELGKDQKFRIKSKIKGTLNNLNFTNLDLSDKKNTKILGDINFRNLFGGVGQEFYMKGNFDKITSNYENLASILPNVLGKKLPTSLKKLGQFNIKGKSEITTKTIIANVEMLTALGNLKTDLQMSNIDNIDNAKYMGNISMINFDIGTFLNRKDVGKVTLTMDVDGKGFTQKYLKTNFSGKINNIFYNGYDYNNVVVNGNFKKPIFSGKIIVRDPNLSMDFDGIVDLSQKSNRYIFDTNIDFVDLKKLNFIKDSVSKFIGNIKMNVVGSSIDDFQGNVNITNSTYQNKKTTYSFDDFELISNFDQNNIRTINFNSPDIINGQIVGKFKFNQLSNMLQNAIGSLYTNYKPNKVAKGQFLKFDFNIYNKIIEVFYPGIEIATNTKINGNINSDNDEFKFKFNSPQIAAFDNYFDNLRIEIDNKNPLFNTYVELDSIRTKQYKIQDFSLINVTQNDTLFLRSEFKGGNKGEDNYNLNLFHTINNDNKNVVGIKKSEVKFKENIWFVNENENKDNKIVFDKKLTNFDIDKIIMSHENQSISLFGNLQNQTNKDLKLSFNNVDLTKISPSIDKFKIDGILNGDINILQKDNIYQPTADVDIDLLKINNIDLGKLNLNISGDNNLSKFFINSSLENKNLQAFSAKGNIDIKNNNTIIDLDLNFDQFNLGILSSIGGTTITNIRGLASGNAKIEGNVNNPDMNGRLYLDNAGLNIPYLNVNYGFDDQSVVDVSKTKFLIRKAGIFDNEFKTKGILNGFIQHKNFGDWKLDLNLESDNILALNTLDSEDAMYYGKAFILGNATIKGPVSGLFINVEAKSNKDTEIKIPINDSESVGDKSYIHFVTVKEKNNLKSKLNDISRNYEGLELNFDLDITPDANIEIIINKDNGHKMKGNGYGNLNMAINTLGKFNMTGNFQIIEGKYDFRYGGIINKTFDVKKYGTIIWTGDPLKADLNLEAVYKTNANPGVLVENASFNKKVPVNVTIGIKGNLSNPEPDFNIDFPTVNSILKSEIQTKLDDKDTRQKQSIVLLSTGSFLSTEGLNQTSAYNNLYEKASSLLDGLFEDKDSKIKFGLGYNGADIAPIGQASAGGRVDVNFTTQLSEKIIINGKLAVPVGGVTETAVVGNVEVLYRVNEDGTLNLRVFNRENEINYIGEGIGYTQGGGISYEVDFDTFKELLSKVNFLKNKNNKTPNKKTSDFEIPDSELKKSNFNTDKEKPKKPVQESKPDIIAVPKDDD